MTIIRTYILSIMSQKMLRNEIFELDISVNPTKCLTNHRKGRRRLFFSLGIHGQSELL